MARYKSKEWSWREDYLNANFIGSELSRLRITREMCVIERQSSLVFRETLGDCFGIVTGPFWEGLGMHMISNA